MRDVIKKLTVLFDRRERRRFLLLMLIMVMVAFAEVFGISVFLVFLRVLSDPSTISENNILSWVYSMFGFSQVFYFQVFLAVMVMVIMMLSLAIKAGGNYAIIRFAAMRGFSLSSRLLQAYLHQPYTWFLERNTADISKSVLGEVQNLIGKVVIPGIRLLSSGILTLAIVVFLLIIDPAVAIFSALLLGCAYAAIYYKLRGTLLELGQELLQANKERFRLTQEATGGFKEVKLLGLEDNYVASFRNPAKRFARSMALSQVINQLPRIALEGLTFAVLLSIILFMIFKNEGDMTAIIPTLGVFAIAVMRLLPALQRIYSSVALVRNGGPLLDHIYEDYCDAIAKMADAPVKLDRSKKLSLDRDLVLKDIGFSYATSSKPAVQNLDLTIPAFSTIGIVGGTGAGKTTLVDVILGLLKPDEGSVLVDGIPIKRENMQAWRRSLGYVPQNIYLTDASVAQNIAFGIPPEAIDMKAVERAAKVAALHEFVMNELPEKYETFVGERGVRLSGGQRQRIGIARALYHDPSLLILDEATSALDNLTESAVMEAVQNIGHEKTIIMIAHRLSTVRKCDEIFLLENGRVASSGTYDELVENNATFREMAANE